MNPSNQNRREFLRRSTVASSAAVAAGMLGLPELDADAAPIAEDEKLGVALVGLGSLVRFHTDSLH